MKSTTDTKKATLADLRSLLAQNPLSASERKAFKRDLQIIRKSSDIPALKWPEKS